MWRWQLKTCWSCYCCWSWWWETCRQQFGCRFGRLTLVIKLSFCSDFEDKVSRFVQDFEVDVRARFWSWALLIILLLMLGCGYEVHSWSKFWFGLVKIFKFKFCRNGDVWLRFWSWCKVEILKMFDQHLIWPKEVNLVSRTQPSGPLCLWQCFTHVWSHFQNGFNS